MSKKMACTSKTCEWVGSEDQIDWKFPGEYTQDDVACCPECGEVVRYAVFWLMIRIDGGMYRGTVTCEAQTLEEAAEYAENICTVQAGMGAVCDIFGPFDDLPKSAL